MDRNHELIEAFNNISKIINNKDQNGESYGHLESRLENISQVLSNQQNHIDKLTLFVIEYFQSRSAEHNMILSNLLSLQRNEGQAHFPFKENDESVYRNKIRKFERVVDNSDDYLVCTTYSSVPSVSSVSKTSLVVAHKPKKSHPLTRKFPTMKIKFLSNPLSVQDLYDEFTKGIKDQLPLGELDKKYGKFAWRGDSQTKESKMYQRRKRLYNAIESGVENTGLPVEVIIGRIEEFRGNRPISWVMNGNFPPDIKSD